MAPPEPAAAARAANLPPATLSYGDPSPPLPVAALAVAGLGGGLWLREDPLWGTLVLGTAAVAVLRYFASTGTRLAGWLAMAALALGGWLAAPTDPPPLIPEVMGARQLRGRVVADPRIGDDGPRLNVDLDGYRSDDKWLPTKGRVRVSVRGAPDPPAAWGDVAVFSGPLHPAQGFRNPGNGGHRMFLRKERIAARASGEWPGELLLARPSQGTLPALSWRNRISAAIGEAAPGQGGALLRAIALGDRSGLTPETVSSFRRTGAAHVLAISGLHLGILALLLVPALRRALGWVPGLALRCPVAPLAQFLTVPVLVGYAALAGYQTSTVRSLAMVALLLLGTSLSRPVARSGLLAATALTLALWQPSILADPGFQLSVAALAGLFWLAPAALDHLLPSPSEEPLDELLETTQGRSFASRVQAAVRRGAHSILRAVVYSTAAAAATVPLAVFHFGSGSLAGAALSPVVVAVLGFLCLPLALTGVVTQTWLPSLATDLWGVAGHVATEVLALLTRAAPLAPQVAWQTLRTPAGLLGVCALLAALTRALARLRPQRQTLLLTLLGVGLLVVPAAVGNWLSARDPRLHLWVLDVGQGQAVALRAPGGHWSLVDGGGFPTSSFDVGDRVVVPALQHLGATHLDLVVSTHPHPDHVSGLVSALRWGRPEQLWLAGSFSGDPRYAPLLAAAEDVGSEVVWIGPEGHAGRLGAVRLETRWFQGEGENDRSMIFRADAGGAVAMIAADLETAGQKRLLAEGYDPACALLVAPHHGAASSLNPRFLAAAHPEVMIISAAGRRGLPSPRFTAAARALGSSVYATHESGCVHAALGPDSQLEAGAAPR